MTRRNRHHLPGSIWHSTHPCHKREYNLKELQVAYNNDLTAEKCALRRKSEYVWRYCINIKHITWSDKNQESKNQKV